LAKITTNLPPKKSNTIVKTTIKEEEEVGWQQERGKISNNRRLKLEF